MPVETATSPALDDVFLYDVSLPMRATFFPLGFPFELATNSSAVIDAAGASWGASSLAYPDAPVSLSLAVTDLDDDRMPPPPKFRSHLHLMSIVADARNQVICDFSHGCAFGWVTRSVAENEKFLRLHFLESAVMTLLVKAHLAPIHGALVTRQGVGIALCGESHAGKSTLAYACARSGWTLVSDDGTFLIRKLAGRYAVGNPNNVRLREDAKSLFPELASCRVALRPNGEPGMEVPVAEMPVSTASGSSIDHVVFLRRSRCGAATMNQFGAEDTLAWLERTLPFGPPEVQASQRQAYMRLLDAGLWELHYSDLGEAIALLDRLGAAA